MPCGISMLISLSGVPTSYQRKLFYRVAPAIFEKFAGRELLFTLRTRAEGGEIDLDSAEYVQIIKDVAQLYQPEYIDFEYFSYRDVF